MRPNLFFFQRNMNPQHNIPNILFLLVSHVTVVPWPVSPRDFSFTPEKKLVLISRSDQSRFFVAVQSTEYRLWSNITYVVAVIVSVCTTRTDSHAPHRHSRSADIESTLPPVAERVSHDAQCEILSFEILTNTIK